MRKYLIAFFILLNISAFIPLSIHAMSDDQVIAFVKEQSQNGVSQQDIAKELLSRGVTPARLQQIQRKYENRQVIASDNDNLPNQVRSNLVEDESPIEIFEEVQETASHGVFGRSIFHNRRQTFESNVNVPTPLNYRLGPNDEVVIEIWGSSQMTIRQRISAEGSINVEHIGPIYLNGMTVEEANRYLQDRFGNVFAGVGDGSSQIKLTVGQIRTIQVDVMGEVANPGRYSVSSLSTVFHALYRSGGVNSIGSLRSINVLRDGKLYRNIDLYRYILEGSVEDDFRLNDRDIIFVMPYEIIVDITGNVKRPMKYEMKASETITDLIEYAGGFASDAFTDNLSLTRVTGEQNRIFTVNKPDYSFFTLEDGDLLTIGSGFDLFENRVEIKGAIFREGYYELGKDVNTISQLVEKAGGLKGDAFMNRALIIREKEDYTTETYAIDINRLLNGFLPDFLLQKNDIVYIPSMNDVEQGKTFTIFGEVMRPGTYKYSDNTSLEDLILEAGGLLHSASLVRVDVARRISDPYSVVDSRNLAETFTFGIKDGLVIDGDPGFILEPFDHVYIRRSPDYHPQQNVSIHGEVVFPGTYALNRKTERISDIVKRSGNLTLDAYSKGARLVRQRTAEERFRAEAALRMASQGGNSDSISVRSLDLGDVYDVGIELDKALLYPGSDYDLVLRPGDRIIIPEFDNTVKINGAVMYPNTVLYNKNQKVSDYIDQAGGFSGSAKKNKMYVIYMNGTVKKAKGKSKNVVQPGCEIIVPSKEQSRRMSTGEILSVGATVTSMASVITLLIHTLTK